MRRAEERAAWTAFVTGLPEKPKLHGKGRHKKGEMNAEESAYAQELENQKRVGLILDWGFERITLRVAPRLTYTPDFDVLRADNYIQMAEVKPRTTVAREDGTRYEKAYSQEDSRIKIRACAALFPFRFVMVFQRKDGIWQEEEF